MSKKLNFAPDGVDSIADESEILEAQEPNANEKTTPSARKNIIYRSIEDLRVSKFCLILIKY